MRRAQRLLGRRRECAALDQVLADVRAGRSRALVIRGDAGVGKSVLLDHVAEHATGCRVIRAAGAESEMELAFAGLHQFCAPVLEHAAALPAPQRDALERAFGLSAGGSPDRFFVGLAVLGLFSEAADTPIVCLIDDAQWLDRVSAQTLAFVARRLGAESVAMVFAVRNDSEDELGGVPDLAVGGLDEPNARALLDSQLHGPLDERVRDRVVAEARGNPLALLELPHHLGVDDLAGGYTVPLAGRIEESFVRQLEPLPEETQQFVLIAAAEPVGDPLLILRAAASLGLGRADASPADAAGLLTFGPHVRFRHPLVRSAAYRSASLPDRRRVHRALGEATDPEADPDRRAWHRAQAAAGPDEEVAGELERSAGRARARGGYAAAAAFLERAADLSEEPSRRTRRALAAARLKHLAGAPEAALTLLVVAQTGPLDELQRAQVDLVRGQIAFTISRGTDAPPLLLSAARRLWALDEPLARETYRDALSAAWYAGRFGDGTGPLAVARAVPEPGDRPTDALLHGAALLVTDGPTVAAPLLRRGLEAFRAARMPADERLRWMFIATRSAHDLWDAGHWDAVSAEFLALAREAGASSVLPQALALRAGAKTLAGDLNAAASLLAEEEALYEATGTDRPSYPGVFVAAWQGREAEVRARVEANAARAEQVGEGQWLTLVHWASALLYNGLGRYEDAMREAQLAIVSPVEYSIAGWALPELIEAAVRCGRPDVAEPALTRLTSITSASGADWGLGVEALARAQLSASEVLYQEAIERLSPARTAAVQARARLLYGEWLRREGRPVDAREQLSRAADQLTAMGVSGFADRAVRELQATGASARRRTSDARDALTPQEVQIARLAGDGLSNPEIGARLFISPRTVEWHLRKVFTKLDITSRKELR
ncbi:helix-turn-helix transcriptional regulator [Solirubrobacter soli]|uniref:helix-turn-helix transcriptional regulator n=1 Tax=Solirubrobacter soli TaxID=363832 RepID=UPI0004813E4C|nr:LuxR family transcriptional regulator [Solirubrobacter soli]